jgi:Zn-dependent M28 family amino/carboxypeptidase
MNSKRLLSFSFFFLLLLSGLFSQTRTSPAITAEDIKSHVSFLASDDLKGRYTGTAGSYAASEYIRGQFQAAGLKLLDDNGFQNFEVVVSVSAGSKNAMTVNGRQAVAGTDFTPFPFSKNATVESTVAFAGYGFEIDQDSLLWNDYDGIDVTGKWVLVFRGDPEYDKQESRFVLFADDRDKVLIARDKGAAGVIFVSGKKFDAGEELAPMFFDKTQSTAGLPVFHIKRALADEMLAPAGLTIDSLEYLLTSGMKPHSLTVSSTIIATSEVLQEKVMARNVVGMLEGSDPVLKNSFIVIGGHYDHLGMGGPGSGSRFMDSLAVHNGADDNASGTAGVMELASNLAASPQKLKRSIIFIAFDAEELGLLGSKYYTSHPYMNIKDVVAMLNFDMIGRLKDDSPAVMVGGTGTSLESEGLLRSLDTGNIHLNFSPEGFGPSDHAAFYAENIPVFFFSTGAHEDYHTPDDDWDRLNYDGEKELLDIADQLVIKIADRDLPLTFQEAGPKEQAGRAGYRFKVTLGIMPDFTSTVETGLGVGGVKKDGPAFKGGMLKGDVITAIDGKQINDIYDYMNRLKKLQPGQRISVDVLRNDKKEILIIQL